MTLKTSTPVVREPELDIVSLITQTAKRITAEMLAVVTDVIAKAKAGKPDVAIFWGLTPEQAAYLLIECNKRNRDLKFPRAKEYARQISNGQWELQGQGIQFYDTGLLADGQHRLLGAVLANMPIDITYFVGLKESAVDVIDLVAKRTIADAATLEGIQEAKLKEAALKSANNFLTGLGRGQSMRSVREGKNVLISHDSTLNEAWRIALIGEARLSLPKIKLPFATGIVYVLLTAGWEPVDIEAWLVEFQSGHAKTTTDAPLYVASEVIATKQANKTATPSLLFLIVMKAFILARDGVLGVKAREFELRKKPVPNPFPEPV